MEKLLSLLLVLILLLALCSCGYYKTESDISSTSSIPVLSEDIFSEKTRITEDEAIEIASKYWGIKSGDIDEKTGFAFLIMPVESLNDNIKIALKWLVENKNYSTVDMVEIDPYTGEIIPYDAEE